MSLLKGLQLVYHGKSCTPYLYVTSLSGSRLPSLGIFDRLEPGSRLRPIGGLWCMVQKLWTLSDTCFARVSCFVQHGHGLDQLNGL